VRLIPLDLGRPVWVDDPHFRLDYHLRRSALPHPGGDEELRNLVGRVMAQQLDRTKPLWEMWIVEGLSEQRWALVSKVHHCMVDGVSGTDLLAVMLDKQRDPEPGPEDRWHPHREPGTTELVVRSLAERAASTPYELVRSGRRMVLGPRVAVQQTAATVQGLLAMRGLLRRTPESSLNGPIGPHRRWDWARGRLADAATIRNAFGGTVNDVVLTVISSGFRELLGSRGESVEGREVRTLVPVSVRAPGERGAYNNRVSAMFARLPVGIDDPLERLGAVRAQMEGLKKSKQAVAGAVLTSLSGFAPALLFDLGIRAAARVPQRNVNTVTTNVPGPQEPLYAVGRRMLEAFPYVPLAGRVRVGVAIFSYDGALNFGVTGDYESAPDLEVLCDGIEAGMAELVRLAERAGVRRRPQAKKRRAGAAESVRTKA
jgi:diacylglycerol O-acyltransferase